MGGNGRGDTGLIEVILRFVFLVGGGGLVSLVSIGGIGDGVIELFNLNLICLGIIWGRTIITRKVDDKRGRVSWFSYVPRGSKRQQVGGGEKIPTVLVREE